MSLSCDVHLDKPHGVFQPGDVISGRVIFRLQERQLMKALALKISGYAATRWEKPVKEKKQKEKKSKDLEGKQKEPKAPKPRDMYTNREDYLSTINYYIGSEAAIAKIVEHGIYSYTFSVQLPAHCPSTFESATGFIRYELEVFIDYPDRRHSCFSRTLPVQRPYDLREETALNEATDLDILEKKSCSKFWQRQLQLTTNLPQTGFIPGEGISVHVKILNYDLLTLTDIIYKLNLVGTYTGYHKKKENIKVTRTNLVKTVHTLFGQNGSVVQHLQMLHVPETPPNLDWAACKCLQIAYEVEVFVTSTKKKRWLHAQMPIKIGTISLRSNVKIYPQSELAAASEMTRSMGDLTAGPSTSAGNGYVASAPLPETPNLGASMGSLASSFKEADFMNSTNLNKGTKHTMSGEQSDFKPKYLYYEMDSDPQEPQVSSTSETPTNTNPSNDEKSKF